MAEFQRILVGLDESDLGQAVFRQALDLAKSFHGQLHFLHVLQNPGPGITGAGAMSGFSDLGAYPIFADPSFWETQVQSQKEHAKHWLERYGALARDAGLVAGWSCQLGEAGLVLCETAKKHEADLIVLGRRGLSGLAEALAGSVSNYVVHHAPCSVLVVQAAAEDASASL
ncbi:MAG: universal stress protein [Thermosynechococcaceae cyanobacterium MS004]|nr:universal stress protein [Thermosynechococcaceae cyanobacterium MS004]